MFTSKKKGYEKDKQIDMKRDVLSIHKLIPDSRFVFSVILFILIFIVSLISTVENKELGLADGAAEEYFILGWNLYQTGNFFPNDENIPFVFRPPGYCFFIASVLKIAGIPKAEHDFNKAKSAGLKMRIQTIL